jgi:hypothetical protein
MDVEIDAMTFAVNFKGDHHVTVGELASISIAFSLKRLADAAEGARPPIHWHIPTGAVVRAVGESIIIDPAPNPQSELVDVGLREAVARAITELEHDENSRLPVANMLRRAAR